MNMSINLILGVNLKDGQIGYVNAENHPQYGMVVCHICGKAFDKLQQHIYYVHHMSKEEYCDKYGLDHKAQLTSKRYNIKMHDYALQYDMDKQLIRTGKATRFQKGHDKANYKRSEQTVERLREQGKVIAEEYAKRKAQIRRALIEYINNLDEPTKQQTISALNGPVENLTIDQLKLKCAILGYDLDRKIDFEVNMKEGDK